MLNVPEQCPSTRELGKTTHLESMVRQRTLRYARGRSRASVCEHLGSTHRLVQGGKIAVEPNMPNNRHRIRSLVAFGWHQRSGKRKKSLTRRSGALVILLPSPRNMNLQAGRVNRRNEKRDRYAHLQTNSSCSAGPNDALEQSPFALEYSQPTIQVLIIW